MNRLRARSSGIPAPLTIRSSERKLVDLRYALSGTSADTMVTVEIEGPVTLDVWPFQNQTSAATSTWTARELLDLPMALTTAATDGAAGSWTFSWSGGSGVVLWTVDDSPSLTTTIGSRTAQRFGGWALSQLPGSVTDKSITDQSTANAFEIFPTGAADGRVVWKATGSPGNTSYGTAKVVTNPTVGAGAYWVDITDSVLSQTWRLTFDVNANEFNVAPTPSTMTDNSTNTQLWTLVSNVPGPGDQIIMEDGQYGVGSTGTPWRITFPSSPPATNTVTGQVAPAAPFNYGYDPSEGVAPGWIIVTSRTPFGAAIVNTVEFDTRNVNNGKILRRYTLLDLRAGNGATSISHLCVVNNPQGVKQNTWIMLDHNMLQSFNLTNGGDYNNNIFIRDNYIDDTSSAIFLNGQDCQIGGNWFNDVSEDCIRASFYNSTIGNGRSRIDFNFCTNKKWLSAEVHGDFIQVIYNNTNTPQLYATPGKYEHPMIIGNGAARGVGSQSVIDPQVSEADMQVMLLNDLPSSEVGFSYIATILGNVSLTATRTGLLFNSLAAETLVSNNTMAYDETITSGTVNVGRPLARIGYDSTNSTSARFRSNVFSSASNGLNSSPPWVQMETAVGHTPASGVPTGTNNVAGFNITTATAAWDNPSAGTSVQNWETLLAALTPKAGGVLTVAGGASAVVGAVETGLINHRARTYLPALLT
jgi:hypothetical protein